MGSKINDISDQAAGKAQSTQGESLAIFLASLTTSGAVFVLGLMTYKVIEWKFPEYFYQRTHHILSSRWRPVPFDFRVLISPIPDPELCYTSGFENYLFDRYLQIILRIFILLGIIILPILLPINIINGRNELEGVRGLDRLSYSNISLSHTGKYWFHLVLAIFTITSVCYVIQKELMDYTRLQRDLRWDRGKESCLFLASSSAKRLSAKTIKQHFHGICGGVCKITMIRDFSSLHAKIRRRDILIRKLETAETIFIKKANCQRKKLDDQNEGDNNIPLSLWLKQNRPCMRLPLSPWLPAIPFVGLLVDTIHHLRIEVARHNLEIEWHQQNPNGFPPINSAFVYFNTRLSTPLAALALKARVPPTWTIKQGTMSNDTIWCNISMSWWQKCIRTSIVYILVALLILGFAFPVTIAGSLSQIEYLINIVPWLRWIGSLPSWFIAGIQGVLPPAMLALITAAVPIIIRLLANLQGHHSRQVVENHVQIYYYTFLFVQVFLTVSLSAGITTLIGELKDQITSTPAVLAQNLPKACNYFFSYILILTFTTVVSTLVEVNRFMTLFILSPLFDKTAREKWARGQMFGLRNWGTFIPILTNVACIGLIYSVIAPLILVFCIIYFGVLWLLYRSYPPKLIEPDVNSCSLFYPTAIRQLFTGVYFMELCLTGLFFLVRDAYGKAACITQAIIMIFAMVFTVLFHCTLDYRLNLYFLSSMETNTQTANQTGNEVVFPKKPESEYNQDEALTSARPILWIPKDELGVADYEISSISKTYKTISMSNEGADLDARGQLRVWGVPPALQIENSLNVSRHNNTSGPMQP